MDAASFEEAVEQLAAVPPRAFAKERNSLAARLAKVGQTATAAKVKALRTPTVPVWTVNRLADEYPKLVDRLVSSAERVGAAQLGRDTTMPLGAAMTAYREATDALLARLDHLLAGAEVNASHPIRLRIRNTLMAAAADPKTRKALREGRLEQELTASGFDLFAPGSRPDPRAATPVASAVPSARERRAEARDARTQRRMEARAAAARERAAHAERLKPLHDAAVAAARALAEAKEDARRAEAVVVAAARRKREADQALRTAKQRKRSLSA